jgi:hypothetical protein
MTMVKSNITPLRFVMPATLIFFLISANGIYHHELWLDEAQHFLIARDSDSLKSLYFNMQYDGHVRLWNYLLFFITHYISASPGAMQTFHLLIITVTAFILLRFAPFDFFTKLLIIAGYFFLYEYNVLSRNYALGILFLFSSCKLLADESKNSWLNGLMLILMSNTHLFFAFAACGIFMYMFVRRIEEKKFTKYFFILSSFLTIALLSVIIQINIPPDNTYFHPDQIKWTSAKNFSAALFGLVKGLFPLPLPVHGDFWNHFMFDKFPAVFKLLFGVFLIACPFLLLRKYKPALVFYICSVFLLFSFLVISQSHASRYFGMIFVFFIAAAWLAGNESIDILTVEKLKQSQPKEKLLTGCIYALLVVHLFSGIYAYANDFIRPFSEARDAADFLKTRVADKNSIVVDGYGGGPALSAYLGSKVFYLNIDQAGSYCYWKRSYFDASMEPVSQQLKRSAYANRRDSFFLVSVRSLADKRISCDSNLYLFKELVCFTRGIIKPDYFIYSVIRRPANTIASNENK